MSIQTEVTRGCTPLASLPSPSPTASTTPGSASKKERRVQMIKDMENDQARQDTLDMLLTEEQEKALNCSFDGVKTEFHDLDGYIIVDDEDDDPTPRPTNIPTLPSTPSFRLSRRKAVSTSVTKSSISDENIRPSCTASSLTIRALNIPAPLLPPSSLIEEGGLTSIESSTSRIRTVSLPSIRSSSFILRDWMADNGVLFTPSQSKGPGLFPSSSSSSSLSTLVASSASCGSSLFERPGSSGRILSPEKMRAQYQAHVSAQSPSSPSTNLWNKKEDDRLQDEDIKRNLENAFKRAKQKGVRSPLSGVFDQQRSLDGIMPMMDLVTKDGVGLGIENMVETGMELPSQHHETALRQRVKARLALRGGAKNRRRLSNNFATSPSSSSSFTQSQPFALPSSPSSPKIRAIFKHPRLISSSAESTSDKHAFEAMESIRDATVRPRRVGLEALLGGQPGGQKRKR